MAEFFKKTQGSLPRSFRKPKGTKRQKVRLNKGATVNVSGEGTEKRGNIRGDVVKKIEDSSLVKDIKGYVTGDISYDEKEIYPTVSAGGSATIPIGPLKTLFGELRGGISPSARYVLDRFGSTLDAQLDGYFEYALGPNAPKILRGLRVGVTGEGAINITNPGADKKSRAELSSVYAAMNNLFGVKGLDLNLVQRGNNTAITLDWKKSF